MTPGDELLFLPLGGSGEIGMNLNLYGCRGKWVIVDFGMTFGHAGLPGIDLVFPDIGFIEERRKDLLGIVLTHGHEDHIGAIPYLAADLGVPLYATPFTAGLIREKLIEEGLEGKLKVKILPMDGSFTLGPFGFRYVHLAHSIPEGNALVIETPHGRVFHTGDWKLDDDPIVGSPAPAESLAAIGDEGVLALVCDSTNVFNRKESGSEGGVRDSLHRLLKSRKGRIVITTFASNAARVKAVAEIANWLGRRLVLVGRSMERIVKVARESGYLRDLPPLATIDEAEFMPPESLLILCTGCQGEPRAALSRIATRQHSHIRLDPGDLVVFSSKQIPGNEIEIGDLINALVAQDIEVITEKDAHVHVSGHPGQPELKAMYGWIRPHIAVPVHGELRHMSRQADLARSWGAAKTIVPRNGTVIRLAPEGPAVVDHVAAGRLVLDGDVIIGADSQTMVVRRRLQHNGYLAATLVLDRKGALAAEPVINQQGLPVENDQTAFLEDCATAVEKTLKACGGRNRDHLAEQTRIALRRIAREYTAKRPVTEVNIIQL